MNDVQPETSSVQNAVAGSAVGAPPGVRSRLSAGEILSRLDMAARRGKLPGYMARGESGFVVTAFGEPFDHDLIGAIDAAPAGEGGGSVVRFELRMRPKLPAFFVLVIALSVWPGVWLTHSMLVTYFSWYKIQTWWWYIPLTVVPLFWMVPRMLAKSREAVGVSTAEQVEKIREAVEGTVEGG